MWGVWTDWGVPSKKFTFHTISKGYLLAEINPIYILVWMYACMSVWCAYIDWWTQMIYNKFLGMYSCPESTLIISSETKLVTWQCCWTKPRHTTQIVCRFKKVHICTFTVFYLLISKKNDSFCINKLPLQLFQEFRTISLIWHIRGDWKQIDVINVGQTCHKL